MKKIIIMLTTIFLTFILTGCPMETTNKAAASSIHRMVVVEVAEDFDIVYDKKTKVMYTVSQGYYNRGNLTLLVNADGTPLLYEGE